MQKHRTTYSGRGFTLIELLVVVLILGILMATALPLYLSTIADSQKRTCRTNMQTIANAAQALKVKNIGQLTIPFSVDTATLPDLGAVPLCPTGGTYSSAAGTSGAGSYMIRCTQHGNFEPGVDSN
jgi:type IV pilus assembly protein PilA